MNEFKREPIQALENKHVVASIIGSVCKKCSLLRETNISIKVDFFNSKLFKIVFSAINNMVDSDYTLMSITSKDIANYLGAYPNQLEYFLQNKGIEFVDSCIELANIETFSINYNKLRKNALLKHYYDNLVDIRTLFDYEKAQYDFLYAEKISKKLESMSEQEIVEHFKLQNAKTNEGWDFPGEIPNFNVKEEIKGFFSRKKEEPSIGLPFQNLKYNNLMLGMQPGRFLLRSADTGCVDANTEYFNGKGWTRIADYDGGMVMQYTKDGKGEMVLPERYIKEECEDMFELKTKYGVHQVVSEDHDLAIARGESFNKLEKMPFTEFRERHEKAKNGFTAKFFTTFNHSGEGIELTDEEIRVMVMVIADGSFMNKTDNRCRVNLKKQRKKERLELLLKEANIEWKTCKSSEGYTAYLFHAPKKHKYYGEYWYGCNDSQLNVIWSEVMEWDGSKGNGNRIGSFSTTIKESADFIQYCATTRGFRASIKLDDRRGKVKKGTSYITKSITYNVAFTSRTKCSMKSNTKAPITPVKSSDGYKYCFTVPSGMLVLRYNNTINITGNCGKSRTMMADAAYLACEEWYDFNKGWIDNGKSEDVLYISTELEKEEILTMFLASVSGIETSVINKGNFTPQEVQRLNKAEEVLTKANIFVEEIEDFSVRDIEEIIEKHIVEHNIKVVFFDYLQIVPKMNKYYNDLYGMQLRGDEMLCMFAQTLKQLAKKYQVYMVSSTQLSRGEGYGSTRLAGGKATANKVDTGIILTNLNEDFMKKIRPILDSPDTNYKEPDYVHCVYKNRLGLKLIYIFTKMNLGNCREEVCFCTDYNFNLKEIPDLIIKKGDDGACI
ncbi:MAG: DnaB-like helicase C-terminal domain-containing protein [Clostridium sp.]|uniref:DnaB-like helicase C-terminal domain-containing protein n=1 Tax=Clostridium sp. TaxID=1506 RepID=UPI003F3949E4